MWYKCSLRSWIPLLLPFSVPLSSSPTPFYSSSSFFPSHIFLFCLFLWGIKILVDKKLCRPRSSVHVVVERLPFTHACVYSVWACRLYTWPLCHFPVFVKRIYAPRHSIYVCMAFLYRDWNIKQNGDYHQKQKTRKGSNHIPYFERDKVCVREKVRVCLNVCKLEYFC